MVLAALVSSTFSTSLADFYWFNCITILTVIFRGGFGCCIFNYIHPPSNNKQTLNGPRYYDKDGYMNDEEEG